MPALPAKLRSHRIAPNPARTRFGQIMALAVLRGRVERRATERDDQALPDTEARRL